MDLQVKLLDRPSLTVTATRLPSSWVAGSGLASQVTGSSESDRDDDTVAHGAPRPGASAAWDKPRCQAECLSRPGVPFSGSHGPAPAGSL